MVVSANDDKLIIDRLGEGKYEMKLEEYIELDGTALSELIRDKEITATELVHLSFDQLEKVNPLLNIVTHTRKKEALIEAEKINQTFDQSAETFAGVPILLKNISQAVAGDPLTSGATLLAGNIAKVDSHFVNRLRNAGFIPTGHTNAPEFGLKNITEPKLYGATKNPWNVEYAPGGSSGGAAAAIASGVVPIAGASDGGGSIRIPASFSGLFGLKPTRGRTPVGPGVGRQWQGASIDFVLSKTVRDTAQVLQASQVIQQAAAFQTPLFAGSYLEAMRAPLNRKLRIGFTTESPVGTPVSEDAKEAVSKVVKWLEAEGHQVEEAKNEVDGVQLMRDYFLMNSGEMTATLTQLEKALGKTITKADVEIESWILYEAGKSVSAAEYSGSIASWDTAAAQMAKYHENYDLYITPTTAYPAPKIGELSRAKQEMIERLADSNQAKQQDLIYEMFLPSLTYTPFTQLANLTGQPAISVPVHLTKEGLPLGVQVMASKGAEDLLLQIANQLEETALWIGMQGNSYFSN